MINQMQNWWDRPLDLVKPQCKFYRFAFHNINLSLSHHFSLGKIWRVASRIVDCMFGLRWGGRGFHWYIKLHQLQHVCVWC